MNRALETLERKTLKRTNLAEEVQLESCEVNPYEVVKASQCELVKMKQALSSVTAWD